MNFKVTLNKNDNLRLERRHTKICEITSWELIWGKIIIGAVTQQNSRWYPKHVGWQTFNRKYWLGSLINGKFVVSTTRKETINQMLALTTYSK